MRNEGRLLGARHAAPHLDLRYLEPIVRDAILDDDRRWCSLSTALSTDRRPCDMRRHKTGAAGGLTAVAMMVVAFTAAISVSNMSLAQAQGRKTMAASFQIMEASIDDIHAAFKSGKLTARRLVQRYLGRINAYDKQGPNINSIITLN